MKTNNVATSKALLLNAVERWTTAHWGRPNFARLAAEAGIGLGTAARLKDPEVTIGLDKVHAIAQCFGVEIWEFLNPSVNPLGCRSQLSPEAHALGLSIDEMPQEERQKVLIVLNQVIDLAKDLKDPKPDDFGASLLCLPAPPSTQSDG